MNQKWKKALHLAAASALLFLLPHHSKIKIAAEDDTLTYYNALSSYYISYQNPVPGTKITDENHYQKEQHSLNNGLIEWKIGSKSALCVQMGVKPAEDKKYTVSSQASDIWPDQADKICGYAYIGMNDFRNTVNDMNDLYFGASQLMIWESIEEIKDEGNRRKINVSSGKEDAKKMEDAKTEIKNRYQEYRKNGKEFYGNVYTCAESADSQMMLTDVGMRELPTSFEFKKYLVMREDAKVPDISFSYIIRGTDYGTDVNSAGPSVYNGMDPELVDVVKNTEGEIIKPMIGNATFTSSSQSYSTLQENDAVDLKQGEKYVCSTVNVDFENVKFREPGIYRYEINEVKKEDEKSGGMVNDERNFILDVYTEQRSSRIKITSFSLMTVNPDHSMQKMTGFTNRRETVNLEIKKETEGTQASKNRYFDFTLKVEGALPESSFDIDLTNAQQATDITKWNKDSMTNPTELKTDDQGNGSVKFHLHDGQSIRIVGLDKNSLYSVREVNEKGTVTGDGYTVTGRILKGDMADSKGNSIVMNTADCAIEDDHITQDTAVLYTNTKNGSVPTGIFADMTPWLLSAAFAAAGLIVLRQSRLHS